MPVSIKERERRQRQRLMTLHQISEEFGPPYMSVRKLVLDGDLPIVRLGSSRRYWVRRQDAERLFDTSTTRG